MQARTAMMAAQNVHVRWLSTIVFCASAVTFGASPELRVEMQPVTNGAELITVFGTGSDGSGELPLVSILRDTLGDSNPENDRLRYIWVLTSSRPTILQNAAALIPFFYFHPDLGKSAGKKHPASVLDLGDTSSLVWSALAQTLVQVAAIDSNGALIRSSTRHYRTNAADRRHASFVEAETVVSQLEDRPGVDDLLSDDELLEIQARLNLASKMFGGLVHPESLPEAYFKNREALEQMRGHNWEFLRQRAEANGLYFEPLGAGRSNSQLGTHALLWVAREDLGDAAKHFDGHYLGISDPFTDSRLRKWNGFTLTRYYDASGQPVDADAPGVTSRELIPLALYSLKHPKVPLLLADFRALRKAKKREMVSMAFDDTVTGVIGVSKWGNWPYMAGMTAWNFVRTRHGAASDRNARIRAFAQVRRMLAMDGSVDPGLKAELQERLEMMGVNPLADHMSQEEQIAQRQYQALLAYAADPKGLPARLDRDRRTELDRYERGPWERTGIRLAHWASFGIYSAPKQSPALVARSLDRERRATRQIRFLDTVAKSSPQTEIVWNMDEVKRALSELSESGLPARSVPVVERLLQRTNDAEIRALAEKAVHPTNAGGQ